MKHLYFSLFIFFFLGFVSSLSAFTFDDTAGLNKKLVGFYKSHDTSEIIFLRYGSGKSKTINNNGFLEINNNGTLSLNKYIKVNKTITLYSLKPSNYFYDYEIIDTLCKKMDFEINFLCKVSEYKHVQEEKKVSKINYQLAMNNYLTHYGDTFDTAVKTLSIQNLSNELPKYIEDTEVTSAHIIYKTYNPIVIDYQFEKESFWFLSLGKSNVTIYINGLDFRDGLPDNKERHIKHINEWKPYYTSKILENDFNIVYSWDPSLGITKENRYQLEMLIKFILQNNNQNKITLIAHSHGGNLAKEILVSLYDEKVITDNIKLITLATPHKGINNIDSNTKYMVPVAEVIYDMFSFNLNKHKQIIQASKKLYNDAYNQLEEYEENDYLQQLNKDYVLRELHKNTLFIAAKHDDIIQESSSLLKGVEGKKFIVNNSHSNIVDTPDTKIFQIIADFK